MLGCRIATISLATALAATGASAGPQVVASLGFGGQVRHGEATHVRLEIENPGEGERIVVLVRESAVEGQGQRWEVPLDVPPRSRRVETVPIVLSARGAQPGVLSWSIDGTSWRDFPGGTILIGDGVALAVVVTARGHLFPQLRSAVDPQGRGLVNLAVVRPEHAPRHAAAWEPVDLVFVDADAAATLGAEAWSAIGDRVLAGATLVVHGSDPLAGVPEALLAGESAEGAALDLGPGPGQPIAGRAVVPVSGARALVVAGTAVPWAATRRFGFGRLVTVGASLHDVARPSSDGEPWLAILGATAPGDLATLHARAPRTVEVVRRHSVAAAGFSTTALLVVGLVAVALGTAATVAAWLVGTSPRRRDRAWWLIPAGCLGLALPGFACGAIGRLVDTKVPAVTIEEVFADAGRRRVTTIVGPLAGEPVPPVDMPDWPVRAILEIPYGPGDSGTFVVGRRPVARGFRGGIARPLYLACERWEDAGPSFDMAEDGETLRTIGDGRDIVSATVERGGFKRAVRVGRGSASPRQATDSLPEGVLNDLILASRGMDAIVATTGSRRSMLRAGRAETVVIQYDARPSP